MLAEAESANSSASQEQFGESDDRLVNRRTSIFLAFRSYPRRSRTFLPLRQRRGNPTEEAKKGSKDSLALRAGRSAVGHAMRSAKGRNMKLVSQTLKSVPANSALPGSTPRLVGEAVRAPEL
jgi:hypothetical protein